MKRKILVSIVISFIINGLFAQNGVIKGYVYSKSTGEALELSSVYFKKRDLGTYTNKNGYFELPKPALADTLIISFIGYRNLYVISSKFEEHSDTLFLENTDAELPEIIITNKNFSLQNSKQVGYINSRKINLISSNSGVQFAVYIPNPDKSKSIIIKGVAFLVKNNEPMPIAFKIHLYKNKDNSPGEELSKSEFVEIIDPNPKLKYSIDLHKYRIDFPIEGLFVGIEWVGIYENTQITTIKNLENRRSQLGYTFGLVEEYTWRRFMGKPWQKVRKENFPGQKNPLNCAFSVLY